MKIKINSLVTPFIDTAPRFSWTFPDSAFSAQQEYTLTIAQDAAYEDIICTCTEKTSEHSNLRPACDLKPCTKYYVKVCAHLENGEVYCAETHFATGFMHTPWDAWFITGAKDIKKDEILHAIYLRREFSAKKVKRAVLYVVGLGYFEAHINGAKVGDDFLSTPYTAYDHTILYRAFDVTDMIACGENAVGVILGNGFYNSFTQDPWQSSTAYWRDVPKLMAEIHLEYEDHTEKILSDDSWQCVDGPIRFNGIRHGEAYDANLEKDGWDMPRFLGETHPVRYPRDPGAVLTLMEMEPIRIRRIYKPTVCRKVKAGWLYEFEKNMAGMARITFRGKAGTKYKIRYCDRLFPDGELDQASLAGFIKNYCFQTDEYTKRSDEPETWHAIFAYYGFQYIEISAYVAVKKNPDAQDSEITYIDALEDAIAIEDIDGLALCNDFEKRAEFTCSDPVVNAIEGLCHNATLCCCMNTFVSDAVREKSSWTGDTGLSAEQLLINYGAENMMRKWQQDLRESQRPGGCLPCIVPSPGWGYTGRLSGPDWSSPMVDVPWNLYREYGDLDVLRENHAALCAHVNYIASMAHGFISRFGLGDWCPPFDGPALAVNMSSYKCPLPVSDTAYFYSAAKMAETSAALLGYSQDEKKYADLAKNIKEAFRDKYFDKETYTVAGDCQTSTAMMVYHGLAEETEIPHLVDKLEEQIARQDGHLDFGVLGCKAVMEVLGRYGKTDLGIKILTNPTYPSMKVWLDMGATSLFECWNGGGSRNHHMFSSVSAFFHKYVAGLSAAEPGYRKISFRPAVNSLLTNAYAFVQTPYGKAESGFEKRDGKVYVTITVPASCIGTLYLGDKTQEFGAGKHTIVLDI